MILLSCKTSNYVVSEVLGHIRRSTLISREQFNAPENLICLDNGILDINTMQINNHTDNIIFLNKIPVNYDSTIEFKAGKQFLNEVLNDDENIKIIQEFIGYLLYKKHPFHKALMMVGGGANGKSTLINLIKTFLGFKNCTSIPLQRLDTDKFATSQMYGKLANLFADLPPRGLKETSIFKMLTGEDFIPAQRKFKDEFQFVNYAKQIFSANQVPKSMDDSDAFFRRWLPITFGKQFLEGKADVDMLKKITTPEELSGLLNWAIAGLKRLLKNKKFSSSKSIENVREEYIRMSDSVGAFIMDKIDASPDEYVIKKDLYIEYTVYCRDRNYPIVSEIIFHKEILKQMRVEDFRATDERTGLRIYTWKGIKLRPKEVQEELE